MKKLFCFILALSFTLLKGQSASATSIKIMKEDSTLLALSGDTSYIFNAWVITAADSGISAFTFTCAIYNKTDSSWVNVKDTSFTWSGVSASTHNNQSYGICKPNQNMLKVCLGRLDPAIRRRFIFNVTGNNGTVFKEFNF